MKASEPQGTWAFAAYHSLGLTRPSRLPDPAIRLQICLLTPASAGHSLSTLASLSRALFTTVLALPCKERREGPAIYAPECGQRYESGGKGGH